MPEATTKPTRPKFSNIHVTQIVQYRMPPSARVSIMHRVSGALMFVLLPFILYLFDLSITSENTFSQLAAFAGHPLVKLVILALSWAYLHHFCAGVRHLFMDLHMGIDKQSCNKSAMAVFAVSVPLTALVALKLFGAF